MLVMQRRATETLVVEASSRESRLTDRGTPRARGPRPDEGRGFARTAERLRGSTLPRSKEGFGRSTRRAER